MKKTIGILLILYPVLIFVLCGVYNLDFFWLFHEQYKIYDLLHSLFSLTAFLVGIQLISNRKNILFFCYIVGAFSIYQILTWDFNSKRYLDVVKIKTGSYIALTPYDGGAFTSTSFVNVELYKRVYVLFMKPTVLNTYDSVKSGKIQLKKNVTVNVELNLYSNEIISEDITLLLNK
ncbi:hypothetical protein [Flocculibacter collagenilyticus]|uniref:hypothetical protein n=1 Tax=Flocculibacter collagenilyticus TaxID=2744479 RepID=UPI0018F7CFB6|nr:hypothetical protein [Flocculibacter collagenilyticus]